MLLGPDQEHVFVAIPGDPRLASVADFQASARLGAISRANDARLFV